MCPDKQIELMYKAATKFYEVKADNSEEAAEIAANLLFSVSRYRLAPDNHEGCESA